MKITVTVVLGLFLGALADWLAQPVSPGRTSIYFAPNVERTVTLTKRGVALASLRVPQGTLLSVGYATEGSQLPSENGRFAVHGDVEIRMHASSLRDENVNLEQAMRQAPIVMAAQDVEVVVTQ